MLSNLHSHVKMTPLGLKVSGSPDLMKRRVTFSGLRQPVQKVLNALVFKVYLSTFITPIVTLLKKHGKIPRICEDHPITLNQVPRKSTCVSLEPEGILNQISGSEFLSKTYFERRLL